MGGRKECMKKVLGITEYPWSSDDEEDVRPTQDILQGSNSGPRASIADLPGTSGIQQQTEPQPLAITTRRNQARMDSELFWSIIGSTSRPPLPPMPPMPSNDNGPPPMLPPRGAGTSMCPPPRSAAQPLRTRMENISEHRGRRSDRAQPSADVQRILAFKKLTRSLQNLAQNKVPNSSSQNGFSSANSSPRASRAQDRAPPSRSAGSQDRPSGSPILGPTFQVHRTAYSYNTPWRRSLPSYAIGGTPDDPAPVPPPPWHYGHSSTDPMQPSSTTGLDVDNMMQNTFNVGNIPNPNDNGGMLPDEVLANIPIPPPPPIQKMEPPDEPNENPEEENMEAETADNETGSGARLIEEVVEVDAPEPAENNDPPPPGTEPNAEAPESPAETSAETANTEETPETPQEGTSFHGVKRKRDSSDESNESFSVQEFNQSLLRLLECPVCLEWMEPPISQCRRGHLVCSRCRARLAACPVCRTPFSSVRNRAMEGVAEMLRYPCRHGCGREVRLRRRAPHEASCGSRRYHCPAPPCARHPPLPRDELAHHFQCKHLPILKIGNKHKFSMKVNSEQHDTWVIMALDEFFHLRVDVDIRTWGVIVYVAYIGPKRHAKRFTYEVSVEGQHNSRKLIYTRSTHSDLESSSLNVSRQDCFHLTLDQALNFLRFKNRHCEPDKFLDFDVEISKWDSTDESRDESE